ncbi:uncharacterized protein LOC122954239 [Acropora millepora]|uniref:uncharacterized protein LOC122954239 n=1 Tax=Acropora millepora TaxID=45264 RepID=UPI001CF3A3B0|nr:uncharacterized protein LOC122954239 [Acropora millepora]
MPTQVTLKDSAATKITEMDESFLSYFKGYQGTTCSQDNQALPDNFSLSLSPGSRKEYDEFSPHSKTTFKKGFALAIRKLQKQNREKPANNTHAAETPHSSSKSSGGTSKSPQKDQSDNEESEVCHICGQQSSAKKKNWSRQWIACDTCKSWTHL